MIRRVKELENESVRYPDGHVITVHKDSKVDLSVQINDTQCGRSFSFALKRDQLIVSLGAHKLKHLAGNQDWYSSLTEQEKVDLMQVVAAHYRAPSLDPDGMKTSAIGVVPNPDPNCAPKDRHLIYVGINNHLNAADNYKGCAEQGMVKSASNSVVQYVHHRLGQTFENKPFIQEIYVMGGRDANPNRAGDVGVPAICPCGVCTDLLAKTMVKGGHVYIMPHTTGRALLTVNEGTHEFSDIQRGEIWKTTIDNLNRHRHVHFDRDIEEYALQRDGFEAMVSRLVNYVPPTPSPEAQQKHAENYAQNRVSIAELDVATRADGTPEPAAVNDYLLKQISMTLHDRLQGKKITPSEDAVRRFLNNKVNYVRCALIQLDDGSYHIGYDSSTGSDKAFVNPEFTALGAAVPKLGTQGVKRVWTMEFNPKAIEAGIMTTSSKDGLERTYKRHSKIEGQDITLCSLPFNAGGLSKEKVEAIAQAHTFDFGEVYASLFAGNGITGGPPETLAAVSQKQFASQLQRNPNSGGHKK